MALSTTFSSGVQELRLQFRQNPAVRRLWAPFRGWMQERQIRNEHQRYVREARRLGRSVLTSGESLKQNIKARLAARGLCVTPKQRIHVIYGTSLSEWERNNIPVALKQFGRVSPFYLKEHGFDDRARDWLHRRHELDAAFVAYVAEVHAREPVDLVFTYLSGWHIRPETIEAINRLGIVTCNFCLDDKLSFIGSMEGGRPTGPVSLVNAYDLNLTSSSDSLVKYAAHGAMAMFWPEGASPQHFHPVRESFNHDVSFVGACYGRRPEYVTYLRRHGVAVETFGIGWPSGPLPASEMVKVYARSRVNLGFGGIGYSMRETNLKGRDFEVPISGAAYLTTDQTDLNKLFDVGREIMTYAGKQDCLDKVRYMLTHPDVCDRLRIEGRCRALRDHTWARRFASLFATVGLLSEADAAACATRSS